MFTDHPKEMNRIYIHNHTTILSICLLFVFAASSCKKGGIELPTPAPAIVDIDSVPAPEVPAPLEPSLTATTAAGWNTLAELPAYKVACGDETNIVDLQDPLLTFATNISSQNIMYKSEELSDCSGMFHRTLQHMHNTCSNYEIPAVQIRTTKGLAQWYAEKGELVMIKDALQMAELIKPGAVMFFGTNGKRFSFPEDSSFVVTEGIQHMGVVVGVDRNDAGEVINYHLFHGRRTGLVAAITGIESEGKYNHLRKEKPRHPSFGNGNQQWVAVARILNPAMIAE